MLYSFLLTLFVIDCILLMVIILLQDSKGGGLAGAFGAGGGAMTQNLFGGRGASTFLSKATTYLGVAFLGLSLIMTFMRPTGVGDRSIILDSPAGRAQQAIPETGLPLLPGALPVPPPGEGAGIDTSGGEN
jgi:preprotein translocase subunit SecG